MYVSKGYRQPAQSQMVHSLTRLSFSQRKDYFCRAEMVALQKWSKWSLLQGCLRLRQPFLESLGQQTLRERERLSCVMLPTCSPKQRVSHERCYSTCVHMYINIYIQFWYICIYNFCVLSVECVFTALLMIIFFLAKKENLVVPNAVEKSRTGAFRSHDQTLSFFFRPKKRQSL